ncbi:MAG: aldo/keto reductase [Bacillota bacterium]
MKYRTLGSTGVEVSEISLGTWQLGGGWGAEYDNEMALETLRTAREHGINCFDTADVYQGNLSERTIGEFINKEDSSPFVITKIGRRLNPHVAEKYTEENLRKFVEEARENMQVKTLDMVLLHCPPTDVYYNPDVFEVMDALKEEGKLKHYGVSVERIEEGLKAMEYEGVEAIEIIFNMFRHRPNELFFEQAKRKNVGVIVRVPLASGLLTGKLTKDSTFNEGDHRHFNREGAAFDKGETFSGVNYKTGLKAAEALKDHFNAKNIAPYALKWILMHDAVSTVIPGASKPEHIERNAVVSDHEPLSEEDMKAVREIYDTYIKDPVHHQW